MSRDVQVVSNFRVEITHKEISDYLLKQEGITEFHKNNKLTLQGTDMVCKCNPEERRQQMKHSGSSG
jgi:hypothetical protein